MTSHGRAGARRRFAVTPTARGVAVLALVACGSSDPSGGGASGGGTTSSGGGTTTGTGAGGAGLEGGGGAGTGGDAGGAADRFPLSKTAGERFLREASGKPFFFNGDAGWSLLVQLSDADADVYLADRAQKGFTVVLVNLLEHAFSDQAPSDAAGEPPFTTPGDYATPNEAYFAHVDAVLESARERGLLVLLTPSYLGYGGGSEGFYQEMVDSGAAKLEEYGRFLGKRYAAQPNILWVDGGDYDPPSPELVEAIVTGIRAEDSVHLHTAHTSRGEAASDVWGQASWLDVDNVYTDVEAYAPALALHQATSAPFFLIEAYYEGEHGLSEEDARYQAWGAVLGGAMGHVFGNNPIWCFGASTCFPTSASPPTWQAQLDGRGSKDVAALGAIVGSVAWEKLAPDASFVVQDGADARAARAADGSVALLYTRALGNVELDLSGFAGAVTAERVDPTSGAATALPDSPWPNAGTRTVTLDESNATGTSDWVVRLQTGG